ncbi:MAG: hypothetical protein AVDCRST_MAG68-537, partial [uncultured Gemmatimonadetes bacterium]
ASCPHRRKVRSDSARRSPARAAAAPVHRVEVEEEVPTGERRSGPRGRAGCPRRRAAGLPIHVCRYAAL